MSPKNYIIKEINNTLDYIKESTNKFDNKYIVDFNVELSTFVISIKGKLDKSLKQGVHSKFNKLMVYKGIVFNYVFIYIPKEK